MANNLGLGDLLLCQVAIKILMNILIKQSKIVLEIILLVGCSMRSNFSNYFCISFKKSFLVRVMFDVGLTNWELFYLNVVL